MNKKRKKQGKHSKFYFKRCVCALVISFAVVLSGMSYNTNASAEMITVPVTGTYGQTEARTITSMVNELRTGENAWAWDEHDQEKIKYDGLQPLTYDYGLEKVAMIRAMELAIYYAHERPNGERCFTAYGSVYNTPPTSLGENIAIGRRNALEVMEAWTEENESYAGQGHRRNMLNKNFTVIGIGHFTFNGINCWVQEFSSANSGQSETIANDEETTGQVEVNTANITSEFIEAADMQLKVGEAKTLPEASYRMILSKTWSWYDKSFAIETSHDWTVSEGDSVKIEDGKIVGVSAGDSKLSITMRGVQKEITVSVAKPVEPTPTPTPTPTPSKTPVMSATPTPTPSKTPMISATPTPTPSKTPVMSATPTPTPSKTPVMSATPTPTPSKTPVMSATPTPTPSKTPVMSAMPTPTPIASSTPKVTKTPIATKKPVKCTGITLNKKSLSLKKGKKFQLKVSVSPKGCTEKIKYTVSNKKIISITSKGKITAKKKGKTWVTVTVGSKKVKCKVTVK